MIKNKFMEKIYSIRFALLRIKLPDINNLKKKIFIFTHNSRGADVWFLGLCMWMRYHDSSKMGRGQLTS